MWNKVSKIIDFLSKEIDINPKYKDTRDDAKNRLKLVLMHDRSKLAPGVMDKMKEELIEVIQKYVEIDKETLDLRLETDTETMALIANIPVLSTKKNAMAS
ncbi:MAG: cell division topological specificity factor MinE [Cyanobacteriota bacterium]